MAICLGIYRLSSYYWCRAPALEEMEVFCSLEFWWNSYFQGQATLHHFSITGIITCKHCSHNLRVKSERHQKSRSLPQDPSCIMCYPCLYRLVGMCSPLFCHSFSHFHCTVPCRQSGLLIQKKIAGSQLAGMLRDTHAIMNNHVFGSAVPNLY